jgi:GyrI-like small molecule binding domain
MHVELVLEPFSRTLYGLSGAVADRDYGAAGRRLMDDMWREIWERELQHKGINHWVYDDADSLFTGVELENAPGEGILLERKEILLPEYAYWKHAGAYSELAQVYERMYAQLQANGIEPGRPIVEIYGHWTADENKLVTEVLINLV